MLAPSRDDPSQVWLVGPEDRPVPVRAVKGLRYLRLLLARPGTPVSALDLTAAVTGVHPAASATAGTRGSAPAPQADLGETLDRRALAEYRARLAELDADLTEARHWADDARAARLTAERSFLLDEIGAATGLHGRPRRQGGDAERARVAVQKSVTAALKLIAAADDATGRLLRDTIRTGLTCSYEPDPTRPADWLLHAPAAPPASR